MIIPASLSKHAIGTPRPTPAGGWIARFKYFEKPGPVAVMKAFERVGYVVRSYRVDGAQTLVDVKFYRDERE